MFALFFSHSCPCWISWTLTCTFLFYVYFSDIFCQWLLIFVCQPFLFRLSYLDHTHILYSNILILTLNTMAEPNLEKLHLTCANDHDDVRVCHWTIANHSLLLQMHWLFLYWVNEVCNEFPEHYFVSWTCIDANKMNTNKVAGKRIILKSSSSSSWTTNC